jgi:hypothetical protein
MNLEDTICPKREGAFHGTGPRYSGMRHDQSDKHSLLRQQTVSPTCRKETIVPFVDIARDGQGPDPGPDPGPGRF